MTTLPDGIVGTGVFATKEEIQDTFRPRRAMAFGDPAGGLPIPFERETAQQAVHRYALAHGLPEISGYYGMTPEGEFVKTKL